MADLAELYARDPLDLTREDLAAIVKDLREKRANFELGEKTAGKAPKPAKAKAPPLDLAALGLKE